MAFSSNSENNQFTRFFLDFKENTKMFLKMLNKAQCIAQLTSKFTENKMNNEMLFYFSMHDKGFIHIYMYMYVILPNILYVPSEI